MCVCVCVLAIARVCVFTLGLIVWLYPHQQEPVSPSSSSSSSSSSCARCGPEPYIHCDAHIPHFLNALLFPCLPESSSSSDAWERQEHHCVGSIILPSSLHKVATTHGAAEIQYLYIIVNFGYGPILIGLAMIPRCTLLISVVAIFLMLLVFISQHPSYARSWQVMSSYTFDLGLR